MPEEYTLQAPPPAPIEEPKKSLPKQLLIGAAAGIIIVTLILGVLLGSLFSRPKQPVKPATTPTPTPTISLSDTTSLSPTPVSEIPLIKFLPNKQYFDDTYVIIEQASPHKALILSVARIEQERGFVEYTKVNYFNGLTWDRKTLTTTLQSSQITTNSLLRQWNEGEMTNINQPKALAAIEMPQNEISFTSDDLTNEISIQSLPGSTKFIYQGKGTITINDDPFPAFVFRSRTYSFNASDLSFLQRPETLTSNWLLFWDGEGAFYYLDTHEVQNPTSPVQILEMGVAEDATRKVVRTTQTQSSLTTDRGFQLYQVSYSAPIGERVNLPIKNTVSKSPSRTYTWNLSIGEGQAVKNEGRTVQGVGIIEYIKPN